MVSGAVFQSAKADSAEMVSKATTDSRHEWRVSADGQAGRRETMSEKVVRNVVVMSRVLLRKPTSPVGLGRHAPILLLPQARFPSWPASPNAVSGRITSSKSGACL